MHLIKGLLLVLLALLFAGVEGALVKQRLDLLAAPTVIGTVSGHDVVTTQKRSHGRTRTETSRFAVVEYRAPSADGRAMPPLQATLPGGHAAPIGAEVQLKVPPGHPEDAVEYSLFGLWIVPGVAGLFGAAILFATLVVASPRRRAVASRPVVARASPAAQTAVKIVLALLVVACFVWNGLVVILLGLLFLLITGSMLVTGVLSALRRLFPADDAAATTRRPGAIGLVLDLIEHLGLATIGAGFLCASLLAIGSGTMQLAGANAWSWTPLNLARTALWLPQDFDRALCDAASDGDAEGARWLAGHGARPAAVCAGGDPPVTVATLIDDPAFPRGESVLTGLLVQAVRDNRVADARRFLEQGGSAKALVDGHPLLLHAAWNKLDALVATLLEHGADPNAKAADGTVLSAMATLDQRDKGREYLRLMVAHGGDLERPLADGRTLLLHECRDADYAEPELIEELLDLGANVDRADADGRTCLDYYRSIGSDEIVALLQKHGAHSGRLASGSAVTASTAAGRAALAQIASMQDKEPEQWSPSPEALGIPGAMTGDVAHSLPRGTPKLSGFEQGDRASALLCDADDPRMCVAMELRRAGDSGKAWKVISLWLAPQ